MTALLLAALFCQPGLVEAPAVEAWASEDWPPDLLAAVGRLPGTTLALSTRSNMLALEVARVATRQPTVIAFSPPLRTAHLEQFRKLPRATLVMSLPERPNSALSGDLDRLGPQTIRFLLKALDPPRAAWLAGRKNAEVELDLRGRVPEQEEVALLAGLVRARRSARVLAADPPPVVAGLCVAKLSRLVVDSREGRVPEPMREALLACGAPVRVVVRTEASPEELRSLALLRPSLELHLGDDPDKALTQVRALLAGVAP